jgi:hypothetical protein
MIFKTDPTLPLLWVVVAGVAPMAVGQEYGWLISAAALAAILWFQWGQHRVRAFRLHRAFHATLSPGTDGQQEALSIKVPAHTKEVLVQIRIRPRLTYRQIEILFGFDGDPNRRPLPVSVLNAFIQHGFNREQNPDKNQNHYIDHHNHYHIVQTVDRSPPNTQALGFVVQTREPGRYPIVLEVITEVGEARPYTKIQLIVTDEPAPAVATVTTPSTHS